MKKTYIGIASLSALLACKNDSPNSIAKIEKPNIIFILADDLGYGDLGCYGQKVIKTPQLDKMAAEGIRFTQHYAGSTVSAPSRCCLMTGKHTGHARVRGNARVPLLPSDTTVAELLKTAGYTTALIGKWGLGEPASTGIPNLKGFDYFYGFLNQAHAHNSYPEYLWRDTQQVWLNNGVIIKPANSPNHPGGVATQKKDFANALFTSEALQFIEKNKSNTFFLYLSYTIPHANNEAPLLDSIGVEVPHLGMYKDSVWNEVEKAKAAAISYLDNDVKKIIDLLKSLAIDKNTIVLFTSDNGPHSEGDVNSEFFNSNGSLQGIKRDLTEGGIRVPMIVWSPMLIKGGRVSSHISSFWDFLPTACDLAGINIPTWTDGISYAPELFEQTQKKHDYLYWEFHEMGGRQAVLMENWKGIRYNVHKGLENNMIYLYDLPKDISEQNCLSPQFPKVVDRISSIMKDARTISDDFSFEFELTKK